MATATADAAPLPVADKEPVSASAAVLVEPAVLELACLRTQLSVLDWQVTELHSLLASHRRLAEGTSSPRPLPPTLGPRTAEPRYRRADRLTDDVELVLLSLLDAEGVLSLRSRVAALVVVGARRLSNTTPSTDLVRSSWRGSRCWTTARSVCTCSPSAPAMSAGRNSWRRAACGCFGGGCWPRSRRIVWAS